MFNERTLKGIDGATDLLRREIRNVGIVEGYTGEPEIIILVLDGDERVDFRARVACDEGDSCDGYLTVEWESQSQYTEDEVIWMIERGNE